MIRIELYAKNDGLADCLCVITPSSMRGSHNVHRSIHSRRNLLDTNSSDAPRSLQKRADHA